MKNDFHIHVQVEHLVLVFEGSESQEYNDLTFKTLRTAILNIG